MFARPDRLIIAQYEPPGGLSVIAAAELLGESKRAVSAGIVDLAVRRMISIRREEGGAREFVLRLRERPRDDGRPSTHDDLDVLGVLFASDAPGTEIRLDPTTKKRLGPAFRNAHRRAVARLLAGRLARERTPFEKLTGFWRRQPSVPTQNAYPLVDHLWGVRDYIAWAEADRLAFLQSPSGALIREADGIRMLHLYERLLPYAVLFGFEKEWMREIGIRYEKAREQLELEIDISGGVELVLHLAVDAAVPDLSELPDVSDLGDMPEFPEFPTIGEVDFSGIGDIVDLGAMLEGVGAFFGGLGEFVGGIDL